MVGSESDALFSFNLLGAHIYIESSIVVQWVIIAVLAIVSILLTRNLKKHPDRRQSALEVFYNTIANLVKETMGEGFMTFVPFIGTIVLFILIMNIVPLLGIPSPTEKLSVTVGMAAITFLVVQGYAIKKVGLLGYFKGFFHPLPLIFPLNIIERCMLPVSLSLRLFGNIAAGTVIMKIVYDGLLGVATPLGIGIPIPFHLYFDLFDGAIQMVIFTMLTMVNIKIVSEH